MSQTPQQRQRFLSNQAWQEYINRLRQQSQEEGRVININPLELRLAVYKDISLLRRRPLLVYATKFTSGQQFMPIPNNIDISDVDGFNDLIQTIPVQEKAVDVLIHSPGGKPDATERLVNMLRQRFEEVHFLVPHSAYSAATMLALSGNTITLHPSATLGPIDPQINGLPARSTKRGFEKVRDVLKKEGPSSLPAYIPMLEKLSIELLEICDDSESLSKDLVREWLKTYMLPTEEFEGQIEKVVDFFSDYDSHKIHSRPLYYNKIKDFHLKISVAEKELADLLWESYILIDNFFNMSTFVKLFENTYGVSWGRQFQVEVKGQPIMQPFPKPQGNETISSITSSSGTILTSFLGLGSCLTNQK